MERHVVGVRASVPAGGDPHRTQRQKDVRSSPAVLFRSFSARSQAALWLPSLDVLMETQYLTIHRRTDRWRARSTCAATNRNLDTGTSGPVSVPNIRFAIAVDTSRSVVEQLTRDAP